jgi:hypothetical protein
MRSLSRAALLSGVVLTIAAPPALADGSHLYNVCGGSYHGFSGFALCASVDVSIASREVDGVTKHKVTMVVYNLSGTNGSYDQSVITAIALNNVIPSDVEVVSGSLEVYAPCFSDPTRRCNFASEWLLTDNEPLDSWVGGWLPLDLRARAEQWVDYGIASSCAPPDPSLEGTPLLVTSCDPNGPRAVTFEFLVDQDFTFDAGSLYLRATNGYPDGWGATICVTAEGGNCGPASVVPEPITIVLLGSGLAGMGGVNALRRRRRKPDDVESA